MPIDWTKAKEAQQETLPTREKAWNPGTDSAGNLVGYEGTLIFMEAPRELKSKTGEMFQLVKVTRTDGKEVVESTMSLGKKGLRDAVNALSFPDSVGKKFVLGVSNKKVKTADGLRSYVPVTFMAYDEAVERGIYKE